MDYREKIFVYPLTKLCSKLEIKRNISQFCRFPIEHFSHNLVIINKSITFEFG